MDNLIRKEHVNKILLLEPFVAVSLRTAKGIEDSASP
jgi:hypothetical protein